MFAVFAMLSARCLAAENMTPAQKACCAAMNHDCGHMTVTSGCCTADTDKDRNLSPVNRVDAASQVAPVLVAVLDAIEPIAKTTGLVTFARTRPVKPPGTSTYLLVSSFRL